MNIQFLIIIPVIILTLACGSGSGSSDDTVGVDSTTEVDFSQIIFDDSTLSKASKSKSTNRSTPSNAEKETIKKLVEHGWTAPEEPKETENARDSAEAWGDSVLEYFQDLR
jgi:hypothetical protein